MFGSLIKEGQRSHKNINCAGTPMYYTTYGERNYMKESISDCLVDVFIQFIH